MVGWRGMEDEAGGVIEGEVVAATPATAVAPIPADRRILEDARMQDIARRVLRGESTAVIAVAHGLSARQARRILASEEMRDVYADVARELYHDVDSVIADEKINAGVRQHALQARAQTVLADTYELIQKHFDASVEAGKSPTATYIRAAVEAVKAGYVQAVGAKGEREAPAVAININLTPEGARTVKSAIDESGVDLSDLLFGTDLATDDPSAPPPATPDA